LSAGNATSSGSMTINGTVTASSTTSPGTGGNITLFYSDSTGSSPIIVNSGGGSVNADRVDTGGTAGTVVLQNQADANFGVEIDGLVSANNGKVDVTVTDPSTDVQLSGAGQIVGSINVDNGQNIEIDMGTGSVTLGNVGVNPDETLNVTVETETSDDILSDGVGTVTSEFVNLQSGGNIGTSSQRLQTAVDELSVTANTSGTTQNVFIQNTNASGDSLTIDTAYASGAFDLITNLSLNTGSVLAGVDSMGDFHPGYVSLDTSLGLNINVNEGATISSNGGSVLIESAVTATDLDIAQNVTIAAFGYNSSVPGAVLIEMGTPEGLIDYPGGVTNFEVTGGSLNPQVGLNLFTANSPTSAATIINSLMTLYGSESTNITFEGNDTLTAFTPSE